MTWQDELQVLLIFPKVNSVKIQSFIKNLSVEQLKSIYNPSTRSTLLNTACKDYSNEIIEIILYQLGNAAEEAILQVDENGFNALHNAIKYKKDPKIVQAMLQVVHKQLVTLIYPDSDRTLDILEHVLKYGSYTKSLNYILQVLGSYAPETIFRDNKQGFSLLSYAIRTRKKQALQIILECLIKYGKIDIYQNKQEYDEPKYLNTFKVNCKINTSLLTKRLTMHYETTTFFIETMFEFGANFIVVEGYIPISTFQPISIATKTIKCKEEIQGMTPLHYAVHHQKEESVISILQNVDKINKKALAVRLTDKFGNTVLHEAARACRHRTNILDHLLLALGNQSIAVIMKPNKFGETPLHKATRNKNTQAALQLLEKLGKDTSALINLPDEKGFTPFTYAVQNGDGAVVLAMLNMVDSKQAEIMISSPGKDGKLMLYYFMFDTPTIMALLNKLSPQALKRVAAHYDPAGYTLLHYYEPSKCSTQLVSTFIRALGDMAPDILVSPYRDAKKILWDTFANPRSTQQGTLETIEATLHALGDQAKPALAKKIPGTSQTVFYRALQLFYPSKIILAILQALGDSAIKFILPIGYPGMLYHLMCRKEIALKTLELLDSADIELPVLLPYLKTALCNAVQLANNTEVILAILQLIIKRGGQNIKFTDFITGYILQAVAGSQSGEVMSIILQLLGDQALTFINKLDNFNGWSPLHYAAAYGNIEAVRVLCQNGANHHMKTKRGETPLEFAKQQNHLQVVSYLQHFQKPLPHKSQLSPGFSMMIRTWVPTQERQPTPLIKALFNTRNGANVGHISISIRNGQKEIYISHWPKEKPTHPLQSLERENHTLLKDIQSEDGLLPTTQIILYSLDIAKMHACYETLSPKARWALAGNKIDKITGTSNHNCSSLVYEILIAGGIFEYLLPPSKKLSHPITPEKVAELVREAKEVETILYPETKDFFKADMNNFKQELIAKSNNGFRQINNFMEKNLDYISVYSKHFPHDFKDLDCTIWSNIKNKSSEELLGLSKSPMNNNAALYILPGVEELIEKGGATINKRDERGYNALHCAIVAQNKLLVEKLLTAFPTAVNSLIEYPHTSSVLVTPPVQNDHALNDNNNPCIDKDIQATNFKQLSSTKICFFKNAEPPRTPLELARAIGNQEIIELIIANGGTEESRNESLNDSSMEKEESFAAK